MNTSNSTDVPDQITYLPPSLPTYLPTQPATQLPTCQTADLPCYLPSHRPTYLRASLTYQPTNLPARASVLFLDLSWARQRGNMCARSGAHACFCVCVRGGRGEGGGRVAGGCGRCAAGVVRSHGARCCAGAGRSPARPCHRKCACRPRLATFVRLPLRPRARSRPLAWHVRRCA